MDSQCSTRSDSYFQHTLRESLTFIGRGIHTGRMILMRITPADPDSGIVFIRKDVDANRSEISALWHNVVDTRLSTTLGNISGLRISTVEHLMAALFACGIDNARIILDGPEVPIMDGSALPFVSCIETIGTIRQSELRRAILIKSTVSIVDMDAHAAIEPAPQPWIDLEIEYDSSAIGRQQLSLPIQQNTVREEIAAARTFGFQDQLAALQRGGFALGASLSNTISIKDGMVINGGGLRYPDEFVRHKMLDLIGDLALAGARIIGRFSGSRMGHRSNLALLRELMWREGCWTYTTLAEAHSTPNGFPSKNIKDDDRGEPPKPCVAPVGHGRL